MPIVEGVTLTSGDVSNAAGVKAKGLGAAPEAVAAAWRDWVSTTLVPAVRER